MVGIWGLNGGAVCDFIGVALDFCVSLCGGVGFDGYFGSGNCGAFKEM